MRLNFSKVELDNLPLPASGWVFHQDHGGKQSVRGLAIGVGSTGAKTFYLYRKVHGKPERIKIGPYPDLSIEQARKRAAELNGRIAQGDNPAEAKREQRAELTLGAAFEEYLKRYAIPHGVKRLDELRGTFNRYMGKVDPTQRKARGRVPEKPACGVDWSERKLSTLKKSDLARLHSDIGAAGFQTQANRVIEIVSTIFNRLKAWGLFDGVNPADGIEAFREKKRDRFLLAGELPRFFASLAEDESQAFKDYVLLSLLTGARQENVLGMAWPDVDLVGGLWKIPETKNGEPVTVPLIPEAVAILKARQPGQPEEGKEAPPPWIFPAKSRTGYMDAPKKRWAALLERAGLADLRLHDLRRSMGSWQAKTGASLLTIGKSLGHKSASATLIYARLDVDPVRQSMEKAAGAMLEAGGMKAAAPVKKLRKV
jgi:integrase